MAIQYTSQTITGYNASPPSDDGAQTAANKITWSGIKSKLNDPIKTLAEAINTELIAAFGKNYAANVTTKSSSFSVATSDRGTLFVCGSASYAVNLPACATAGAGFIVGFINPEPGTTTVTITASGAETINGSTTYALTSAYQGIWIGTNGTSWYVIGHLMPAASTANVLAGTQLGRTVTPDALAALWEKASAATATADLEVPDGGYCTVNATDGIITLNTSNNKSGRKFLFRFASALTITHNASSLILPGGQNITVQAGDMLEFISEGSDNWRMCGFFSDSGHPWCRYYNSGQQAATVNTTLSLEHGFGMIPKDVLPKLICTNATGDQGYAQNDEIIYQGFPGSDVGTTIQTTATAIILVQGQSGVTSVVNKNTHNTGAITASRWRWVVTAYA